MLQGSWDSRLHALDAEQLCELHEYLSNAVAGEMLYFVTLRKIEAELKLCAEAEVLFMRFQVHTEAIPEWAFVLN